jgi:hypothetical protein
VLCLGVVLKIKKKLHRGGRKMGKRGGNNRNNRGQVVGIHFDPRIHFYNPYLFPSGGSHVAGQQLIPRSGIETGRSSFAAATRPTFVFSSHALELRGELALGHDRLLP